MTERHFVVIGNGPAGNAAARALRESVPAARVTIVSRTRQSCYCAHLLPDFIAGKIPEEGVLVCPVDYYGDAGIKLRCSQEAVRVDVDGREVILGHKEVLPFDGLVIAAGGVPRIPERLRAVRDRLLTLKTLEDARVWVERLKDVRSAFLIGGDLTSLAVTRALLEMGKKVTLLLDEGAFWPLRADEEMLATVSGTLASRGVEVISGALPEIEALPGGGCGVRVSGAAFEPDLVGAFFGLVPDVAFLAGSGLRIDRGIMVDEYLSTGFDGVYAAGDCAQVFHPELRDYWISVGYENARALGRTAGVNLAGGARKAEARGESIFEAGGVRLNTTWWEEF